MQARSAESVAEPVEPFLLRSREGAALLLLTLLALALRVGLALRPMVIEPDGAFYARLAQEMMRGTGAAGFHPAWPPFYPALIAGLARLLGALGLSGGLPADAPVAVERAARLVSALAGGLLVLPVFALARRVGGMRLAFGAALLTLGHPALIDFSTQVMTESTFTLLFVVTLALLGAAARGGRGRALLAGATGGAALLTRPEAFLLLLAGGLALVLARRRGAALLFLAVALAVALPHLLRVSRAVGHPSLGAKSDYNLAIAYAGHPGVPPLVRSRSIYNNLTGAPPRNHFPEPIPRFDALGLLRADPAALPANVLRQLPKSLTGVLSLANGVVTALALLGAWRRRRAFGAEERAWFLLWLAYVALYALVFVYRRFFAAFLPLLLIEAAAGILLSPVGSRARRLALAPALLLAGLGAAWAGVRLARTEWAFELRALGEDLRTRAAAAPGAGATPAPGVIARRPTVAWYADLPLLALPEGGVAEVARGARERGAGWVVLDERDLGGEAPELARLVRLPADSLGALPAGWRPVSNRDWHGRRARLYAIAPPDPPR